MVWAPKLYLTEQVSERRIEFPVERVLNGGYAGRDQTAVGKHVEELAAIGVPAPSQTPTLYALANYLVTTADRLQVQHGQTSGEVEYVLLIGGGEIYVTVGSDHTDRDLETHSVEWSKQAYPNVIASEVWRYQEVAEHWDDLELRCWVTKDGDRSLYQEATLASLLSPNRWLNLLEGLFGARLGDVVLMSGTVAAKSGIVYADSYDMELLDPVMGRTIRHSYRVDLLREKIV